MFKTASRVWKYTRSASKSLVLALLFCTVCMSAQSSLAQQGPSGFSDPNPTPTVSFYRWDPYTGTWINCTMSPTHLACSSGGTVPVPGGPFIIPLNVSVDTACGRDGFSLAGNAPYLSPALILLRV
jgi:hypothetical protein